MTKLDTFGLPLSGVLHPAVAYRFAVRFLTTENEPLPELIDVLTKQAISISPREIFANKFGMQCGSFEAEFEIDVQHFVIKALTRLYHAYANKFNVCVEYLDGSGNVLRKAIYKECSISSVSESKLCYAISSSDELVRLESRFGQFTKTNEMAEAIGKNELWSSIQTVIDMLNKAEIRIVTPAKHRKQESVALKALTNISYISVENVFPE
jgi:hypothetical protein